MNRRIEQIAVGYDFSVGGQAALAAALEVARRASATVTIITAVPGALDRQVIEFLKRRPARGEPLEVEATFLERVERLVRTDIEDNFSLDDVDVRYDVGEENAHKMILAASRSTRADLVFLGAVGNQPPKAHHTVGTDVGRVIRASTAPVWVVRPGKRFPPERILCAVDFSEAAERALSWSLSLGRLFGARVDIQHVLARDSSRLNELFGRVYPTGYAEAERTLAKQTMDGFIEGMPSDDVEVDMLIDEGVPSETILTRLSEGEYDLLAIGTLGRSAIMEVLVGGTAERVIRASMTSVLAVKPDTFVLKRGG